MDSNVFLTVRPVIISNFGPPALACIRSWGEQGFPVGMVCIGSDGEKSPCSKYLTDAATLPQKYLYSETGIKSISRFLRKFRATGIICISESIACWLNNYRRMLPEEVAIWLPPNGIIENLLSKEKQIEIARKVGLTVPPTYLIDRNIATIESIPREHLPLCLRPSSPGKIKPSFKVRLIHSYSELSDFIRSFQKIDRPIIAQPFLNLPNLVVHGARTLSGATIGLQGFLVERKFEGVTLTIRPTDLDKDLADKCISFTNQFKVTGNYHFEFLVDKNNGAAYFLEINNRLGGTTAKVFACGYDEPLYALQAYGVDAQNSNKIKDITVSSKQALLKYIYYALTDRLSPLDYPDESKAVRILKALWGLAFYRDDVWNWRDLKGSVDFYLGNLREKMGRIRTKG